MAKKLPNFMVGATPSGGTSQAASAVTIPTSVVKLGPNVYGQNGGTRRARKRKS